MYNVCQFENEKTISQSLSSSSWQCYGEEHAENHFPIEFSCLAGIMYFETYKWQWLFHFRFHSNSYCHSWCANKKILFNELNYFILTLAAIHFHSHGVKTLWNNVQVIQVQPCLPYCITEKKSRLTAVQAQKHARAVYETEQRTETKRRQRHGQYTASLFRDIQTVTECICRFLLQNSILNGCQSLWHSSDSGATYQQRIENISRICLLNSPTSEADAGNACCRNATLWIKEMKWVQPQWHVAALREGCLQGSWA